MKEKLKKGFDDYIFHDNPHSDEHNESFLEEIKKTKEKHSFFLLQRSFHSVLVAVAMAIFVLLIGSAIVNDNLPHEELNASSVNNSVKSPDPKEVPENPVAPDNDANKTDNNADEGTDQNNQNNTSSPPEQDAATDNEDKHPGQTDQSSFLLNEKFKEGLSKGYLYPLQFPLNTRTEKIVATLGEAEGHGEDEGSFSIIYGNARYHYSVHDIDIIKKLEYQFSEPTFTTSEFKELLGPPTKEAINELEGGWLIIYQIDHTKRLFIHSNDKDGVVGAIVLIYKDEWLQ